MKTSTITNALNSIYTTLEPLAPKDRRNVVNAAFILLIDEPAVEMKQTETKAKPKAPRKTTAAEFVRSAFKANATQTRAELVSAWDFGDDGSAIDNALARMVTAGSITRQGPGRYAVVKPKPAPVKVTPELVAPNGGDRSDAQLVRDYINARPNMLITRSALVKSSGASETTVDVEVGRLIALGILTRASRGTYTLAQPPKQTVATAKNSAARH